MVHDVIALLRQTVGDAVDGVVAGAVAGSLRPIEDDAYALPDAPRGLGLREPDRRERAQHVGRLNGVDATTAEYGKGVHLERIDPLRRVLFVLPVRSVSSMH